MTIEVMSKIPDGYEWLLKLSPLIEDYGQSCLEDENLYDLHNWDNLMFLEAYDNIPNKGRKCVARCTLSYKTLFGIVVYHPYRNNGYATDIMKWITSHTSIHELCTANPILENIINKLGWKYVDSIIDEYTKLPTNKYCYIDNTKYGIDPIENEYLLNKFLINDVPFRYDNMEVCGTGFRYIFNINKSND